MTLYTASAGILKRRSLLEPCLEHDLKKDKILTSYTDQDAFVGWGNKANSDKLKQKADKLNLPFLRLEDGFIGYVGHPSNGGHALSVVVDDSGIYYDSTSASALEKLITLPLSDSEINRSQLLITTISEQGITKYNCYPTHNSHLQLPDSLEQSLAGLAYVLLIDQVSGDLSLSGANATDDSFIEMVFAAQQLYPAAKLVVRGHPDTQYGKKLGVLAKLHKHAALADVIWFNAPCHPHALIRHAEAVYTVSSQMGFEALILAKPVHCFGMPFYAGWGLTHDSQICERRSQLLTQADALVAPKSVTLWQLVHAALIKYPRYYHPILQRRCEVEDVISLIAAQSHNAPRWHTLYLLGFSMWKKAFIGHFCKHLAHNIQFVSKRPFKLKADEKLLVWGNQFPEMRHVVRIEDGFIRSVGLGSDLCRPSSLVIDSISMYFDASRPNTLKTLLNSFTLTEQQKELSHRLITLLVTHDINKYNLTDAVDYQAIVTSKQRLLVIGQVDGDASTVTGSPHIKTNEALLWAVRKGYPDAYIIYKPHPDVVAGNRKGKLSEDCRQQCVDEQVLNVGLNQLYPYIDALHTMTSLTGFEALMRGKKVVTWGQPFYAGWGLTEDKYPASDRLRTLNIQELAYIALAVYPTYIDWDTGLYSTPEWMITKQAQHKSLLGVKQPRWKRWWVKFGYLKQALLRK